MRGRTLLLAAAVLALILAPTLVLGENGHHRRRAAMRRSSSTSRSRTTTSRSSTTSGSTTSRSSTAGTSGTSGTSASSTYKERPRSGDAPKPSPFVKQSTGTTDGPVAGKSASGAAMIAVGRSRKCVKTKVTSTSDEAKTCMDANPGADMCTTCKDKIKPFVSAVSRCGRSSSSSSGTPSTVTDEYEKNCPATVGRAAPDWATPLGDSCPKNDAGAECNGHGTCEENTKTDRMKCKCDTSSSDYVGPACLAKADVEKVAVKKGERTSALKERAVRNKSERERCTGSKQLCPKRDIKSDAAATDVPVQATVADKCVDSLAECFKASSSSFVSKVDGDKVRAAREKCAGADSDALKAVTESRRAMRQLAASSTKGPRSAERPDTPVCDAMRRAVRKCEDGKKRCGDGKCKATCDANDDVCKARGETTNTQPCADGATCAKDRAECAVLVKRNGCDVGLSACKSRKNVCVDDPATECEAVIGCKETEEYCGDKRDAATGRAQVQNGRVDPICVAAGSCTRYKARKPEPSIVRIKPSTGKGSSRSGHDNGGGTAQAGSGLTAGGDTCGNSENSCSKALSTSISGNDRVINSNGCPGYDWSSQTTPNTPTEHQYAFKMPKAPTMCKETTSVGTSGCVKGIIGVTVSGVPIFGPCDAANEDAYVNEGKTFDDCKGHAAGGGVYHYHSNPICSYTDASSAHSPLLAFMADGIPLYGPRADNGAYPTDLDACGGHNDTTHGFYHYHVKVDSNGDPKYPYTVDCLHGKATKSGSGFNVDTPTCTTAGVHQSDYSSLLSQAVSCTNNGQKGTDDGGTATATAEVADIPINDSEGKPMMRLRMKAGALKKAGGTDADEVELFVEGVAQSDREFGSMRAFVDGGVDVSPMVTIKPSAEVEFGDDGLPAEIALKDNMGGDADLCKRALDNMAVYRVADIHDPNEVPQRVEGCSKGEIADACSCAFTLSSFSTYAVVDEDASELTIEGLATLQSGDNPGPGDNAAAGRDASAGVSALLAAVAALAAAAAVRL